MKKPLLKKQILLDNTQKPQPTPVHFNPQIAALEEKREELRRVGQEAFERHQEDFARMTEAKRAILDTQKHLFEVSKIAFESVSHLIVPIEEWQRLLRRLIPDSEFQRISEMGQSMIDDSLVRLPLQGVLSAMSIHQKVTVEVTKFTPKSSSEVESTLTARFTHETDLEILQYRAVQETQMEVRDLRNEVQEMKKYLYDDSKKKDQMLEELMSALNDGKETFVKIEKINFNKKYSQLVINNQIIQIRADTNHEQLCAILFASKSSIKKTWEVLDIVEAMREDIDDLHSWSSKISDTIRHLNDKIGKETGFKRFILFSNKKVMINPAYIKMLS